MSEPHFPESVNVQSGFLSKISPVLTFLENIAYMLLMVTQHSDMFVIIFTQLGFATWES